MWSVFKKEFKSYFLSPIGYVVVGIFLLVCTVFFYLTTIQTRSIDLGGMYFYAALYGSMIIAPILSMRLFAEERKLCRRFICRSFLIPGACNEDAFLRLSRNILSR